MQNSPAFHTIGIISRPRRSNLAVVVPTLLHWLESRGVRALYDNETAGCLNDASQGRPREQVAEESQLLLVLGGDGTLLAAARVQPGAGAREAAHARRGRRHLCDHIRRPAQRRGEQVVTAQALCKRKAERDAPEDLRLAE